MSLTKRIILGITVAAILSVAAVFLSGTLDSFFSDKEKQSTITPLSLSQCINRISEVDSCRKMFLCMEGIVLLLAAFVVITEGKNYKTEQLKITDKIKIPAPAGEGEHGTARFLTKKEIRKSSSMTSYSIDEDNELIQRLMSCGRRLYDEAENYAAKDNSIAKYRIKVMWKLQDLWLSLKHKIQINFSNYSFPKNSGNTASKPNDNTYIPAAGIVLGHDKNYGKERFYMIDDDVHILILGQTGAGKSRRLVIQSIMSLALAGESIIATDPKGELFAYTNQILKELDYNVICLDFENPELSSHYNPLQLVIDAVKAGDISKAQSEAWDLTSFIVEKAERAEPIWTNGEMSILAAAILCVVYDNMDKPQYQNLTNVYWFIAEMCKDVKMGQTSFKPIIMYVAQLPENHPAKPLLGISSVAPSKTAGSFYTSALTTLRLFITQEIYNMTKDSDFSFSDLGKKKSALFFILPDQSTKYYPIVTMYVSQIYNELVTNAKQNGNRLALRTNFVLDEFGNFAKINGFETMLTVGRGYGIRFNLFIQDFNQLTAKYQKDVTGIIKGNCSTWVYLASSDSETREDLSKRLGQYTTSGASTGSSTQRRSESSRSVNVNLIGRNLLTADEIGRIKSPYLLVSTAQEYPAITELPDLSQCIFNKLLGLGSKKHNIGFIMLSQQKRKLSARKSEEVQLWGIWKKYNFKKEGGFFG